MTKTRKATFAEAKTFLVKNYKHERLYGRDKEWPEGQSYGDVIVNSLLEDLDKLANGELDELLISHHEHVAGMTVKFGLEQVLAGDLLLQDYGMLSPKDKP